MWNKRNAGVTLVELIVALVIVGVALAGMVAVFARTSRASADPVVTQQMIAIADNLMEEILLKPYAVPVPPSGATARKDFNNVRDYNNYGQGIAGIRDVEGNPIAGLQGYSVLVTVAPAALAGIPAGSALQIVVKVTPPLRLYDPGNNVRTIEPYVLTGWRTDPS